MFDVDNKSAVERLAAVVAMLESREVEAREAFDAVYAINLADGLAPVPGMTEEEREESGHAELEALARWNESCDALTAARELTRDR